MKEKRTWMNFLFIGGITILFCSGCSETTEYIVKADFIYFNNTNHAIELASSEIINPNDSFIISIETDGGKNITEESYVPPFPFNEGSTIKYDDLKCDFLEAGTKAGKGEGPAGIQNYDYQKISERYYEFTYYFTEEQFEQAENCN